jgi:Amt family ammonium transporter
MKRGNSILIEACLRMRSFLSRPAFLRLDHPQILPESPILTVTRDGAVPVHCINGIWGTLSLGLFATGEFNSSGPIAGVTENGLKGLFYGGGVQVLAAQAIGSAVITLTTFVAAMVMFSILNAMGILRISKEHEQYGLDLHEHGISAYPEYVLPNWAAPSGMGPSSVNQHG